MFRLVHKNDSGPTLWNIRLVLIGWVFGIFNDVCGAHSGQAGACRERSRLSGSTHSFYPLVRPLVLPAYTSNSSSFCECDGTRRSSPGRRPPVRGGSARANFLQLLLAQGNRRLLRPEHELCSLIFESVQTQRLTPVPWWISNQMSMMFRS